MDKKKILIVEDEKDILDLMALHLRREGHDLVSLESGELVLKELEKQPFSLIILDWMLPGISGLDICKKIRAHETFHNIPIVMVTARAHSSDVVLGLEMGADDYVTKPFDLPVFLARVRALLRRAETKIDITATQLEIGGLKLNSQSYEVSCDGEKTNLTPSEFKLLEALMRNKGRVLTREKLIDLVQGEGVSVVDRTIDTHIFGLRKKLGSCSDIVETIRGVGYRVKLE